MRVQHSIELQRANGMPFAMNGAFVFNRVARVVTALQIHVMGLQNKIVFAHKSQKRISPQKID
jgi:hypothetical protein